MTRKEATERNEFNDALAAESQLDYFKASKLADLLCRHGRTYSRIQESICNDDLGEAGEARREKRESNIERRIGEICAELGPGFEPVFSGDPRGATVKIKLPSGRTNDWGQTGFCVPTA